MKLRLLNLRNLLFLAGIVFQATFFAQLAAESARRPSDLRLVDYAAIYTGGYVARVWGLPRMYDLDLQRQVEAQVAAPAELRLFYPYNHPPLLAHILQLITTPDYVASYLRWVLVLAIFHLAALAVLAGWMRSLGWPPLEVWMLTLSGLLFFPIFSAYLKGQDSAFLLFGAALWTLGLLTGRDRVAGLGLGLTLIRPQIALALALPFLFRRRRVLVWSGVWSLVILLYCTLLVGFGGMRDLVNVLVFTGAGTGYDVNYMPTLMGALVRLYPAIPTPLLNAVGYGGYLLSILGLCLIWAKSRNLDYRHVGLAVLLAVVFAPHLQSHDLSLLLVPCLCACAALTGGRLARRSYVALLPLGISLILTANGVFNLDPVVYLVMLGLGICLWLPARLRRRSGEPLPAKS